MSEFLKPTEFMSLDAKIGIAMGQLCQNTMFNARILQARKTYAPTQVGGRFILALIHREFLIASVTKNISATQAFLALQIHGGDLTAHLLDMETLLARMETPPSEEIACPLLLEH